MEENLEIEFKILLDKKFMIKLLTIIQLIHHIHKQIII
mgnify:CR=1 FL=1